MERAIDDALRGTVRTCADDVGVALYELRHLKILFPIYQQCEAAAGLTLKPPKCVIVPTGIEWHPDLESAVQSWLHTNIPQWSHFKVKPYAVYLGFFLGPAAGQVQWNAPIKKWLDRSKAIAHAGAAGRLSVGLYNRVALPVLGYKCQLLHLPKHAFAQV